MHADDVSGRDRRAHGSHELVESLGRVPEGHRRKGARGDRSVEGCEAEVEEVGEEEEGEGVEGVGEVFADVWVALQEVHVVDARLEHHASRLLLRRQPTRERDSACTIERDRTRTIERERRRARAVDKRAEQKLCAWARATERKREPEGTERRVDVRVEPHALCCHVQLTCALTKRANAHMCVDKTRQRTDPPWRERCRGRGAGAARRDLRGRG
eukprot:742116-Rhodomonas_salina.2